MSEGLQEAMPPMLDGGGVLFIWEDWDELDGPALHEVRTYSSVRNAYQALNRFRRTWAQWRKHHIKRAEGMAKKEDRERELDFAAMHDKWLGSVFSGVDIVKMLRRAKRDGEQSDATDAR